MTVTQLCEKQNVTLPLGAQEIFDTYTDFLLEENEKYNLTAIRDRDGVVGRHLFDSLAPMMAGEWFDEPKKVIDIGTGGGLPGIPLAIASPQHAYTLLDSTEKKCQFLRSFLQKVSLPVAVEWGRAEELGQGKFREAFDVAVSRAVASLPALCELALPMIAVGGTFLAYKGEKGREEWEQAKVGAEKLGGELQKIIDVPTSDGSLACLIIIKKIKKTPSVYPRKWGQIKKKPL